MDRRSVLCHSEISRRDLLQQISLGAWAACTTTLAWPTFGIAQDAKSASASVSPPLNRFSRVVQEFFVEQVRHIEQKSIEQQAALKTKADAEAYVQTVQVKIRRCFGPEPERTPLNARVMKVVERDQYRIENVIFESRPGMLVTANLYVPKNGKGQFPGVVGSCGHSANGKAGDAYQPFAQTLAKLGYVCLIFDPIGQGERLQYVDEQLKPRRGIGVAEHIHAGNQQFLVGVIESLGENSWRALFGVGGKFVLQVAAERRDEATGSAHRPTAIESAQPRRHRAAAGVAGDADMLRIDLLTRQQIVQCSDAVPGSPRAEELADEKLLIARVQMLGHTDAAARFEVLIDVLQSLALPDRVEDQADIAELRQRLRERLIRISGLAVGRMSARADDSGERTFAILWDVQVRGDKEPWPALEDHVLDAVLLTFDDLRHARVERCAFRIWPEAAANLLLHVADVDFGIGFRFERGLLGEDFRFDLPDLIDEPFLDDS